MVATTSQMNPILEMPTASGDSTARTEPCVHNKDPADSIEQSRLPLTLDLANVVTSPSQNTISMGGDAHMEDALVEKLTLKILEVPLF